MKKQYALLSIVSSVFLLISFSNDPPNGKTGAPGDSLCSECHTPQNQNLKGSITVEGFPESITPDQTYELVVTNRDSIGTAVRGGFQMTVLGPTNTRAGTLSGPSANSIVQISGGKQYFEHHPAQVYPDSNLLRWKVQWKAENLPASGTVTCYFAGNVCNGNFQSSGDRTYASRVSGSIVLSATDEITSRTPVLYPNPGSSKLHIGLSDQVKTDGSVYFYNCTGVLCGSAPLNQGISHVPDIPAGVYWIKIIEGSTVFVEKWIKI